MKVRTDRVKLEEQLGFVPNGMNGVYWCTEWIYYTDKNYNIINKKPNNRVNGDEDE